MSLEPSEKNLTLNVVYWIGVSLLLLLADYFTGAHIHFPITFIIPVVLASWYNNRWYGLCFGIVLPVIRMYFEIQMWDVPWTITESAVNALIRVIILLTFAFMTERIARQTRKLEKEVTLLRGLLPICSFCKKVRDDQNQWQPIESYISERTPASFSHGLCPDCFKKHYGDLFKEKS